MLPLPGFHCFIICLLLHCSVLGFDCSICCLLRHYTINSSFPLFCYFMLRHCSGLGSRCLLFCLLRHCTFFKVLLFHYLFVTTLLCSRLQLSPILFVTSLYYFFKVSIALFSASIV